MKTLKTLFISTISVGALGVIAAIFGITALTVLWLGAIVFTSIPLGAILTQVALILTLSGAVYVASKVGGYFLDKLVDFVNATT